MTEVPAGWEKHGWVAFAIPLKRVPRRFRRQMRRLRRKLGYLLACAIPFTDENSRWAPEDPTWNPLGLRGLNKSVFQRTERQPEEREP